MRRALLYLAGLLVVTGSVLIWLAIFQLYVRRS